MYNICICVCARMYITRFYCPGNLSPPSSPIAIVNKNPHWVNDPTSLCDEEWWKLVRKHSEHESSSLLRLPIQMSHGDPPSKACANSIYTGQTQRIHLLLPIYIYIYTNTRTQCESSKTLGS